MRKRLKKWAASKLFNLLKPKYQSLEKFLVAELRKELQEEQFALAIQKQKALHERRRQGTSEWPHIFDNNLDSCMHLKGGKFRSMGAYKDYAVRYHTFADGSSNIKCTICGKEWNRESHDWSVAVDMWNQTTNTQTASEVLLTYPKEEKKWTISSITKTARTVLQRRTSRRKGTRKRS